MSFTPGLRQIAFFRWAVLVLAVLLAPTMAARAEPVAIVGGADYELIATYDLDRLAQVFTSDLDDFMASSTLPTGFRGRFAAPEYPVKLYRVHYRSVVPELDNRPTVASGLVAIPETGKAVMPMISYQHGTVFDRSYVPSNPDASMETRVMLAAFAAQGYIVIGADYFGRGESDLPDSYLVRRSTQQATLDMLLTARDMMDQMRITPTHLFLSGWSQGGWATTEFLHRLEETGIQPTAAAAASPPVDIFLAMNRWLNNPQPIDAVYIPGCAVLQILAQEHYYQKSGLAALAIRPEYLEIARAFYDGKIDFETFAAQTPAKLPDFLRTDFARSGYVGASPYWQVLNTSPGYRMRSTTPLRVYYGGKDEVTPADIAFLPEQTQKIVGGAPVKTVYAGDEADHRGVFLFGVLDQKAWFDELLRTAPPAAP